jgi:hypothetical protein
MTGNMEAEVDLEALSTPEHGYTINDEDDDDPVLLDREGKTVETWRERYPYDERMPRKEYEQKKRRLQVELLNLQNWTRRSSAARSRTSQWPITCANRPGSRSWGRVGYAVHNVGASN